MIFEKIVNAAKSATMLTSTRGTSGISMFGGFITDEEENTQWSEPENAVKNVSLMVHSDVRVRQSLMMIKTPILGATVRIEPASDSNDDIKIAQFVEDNLFNSKYFRWHDILRQQLLYLDYGHELMEKSYVREEGKWWLGKISHRKQNTLFTWHKENGELASVKQTNVLENSEPMLAEQIILTVYEQEGENYNGFSAIRPAWINWKAKMFLIKGDMVSYERFGMGIPMLETDGEITSDMIKAVQKLRANEEGFITKNKKFSLGLFEGGRNARADVLPMVMFHDHQIVFNVMGNFMAKGEDGQGSFAMTRVGADMFFGNVEREANHIEDVWNQPTGRMSNIPQLVSFNNQRVTKFPKLRIENLEFNNLDSFAARAAQYVNAGLLKPTADIKRYVREVERLPMIDIEDEEKLQNLNSNLTIKKIDSGMPHVISGIKYTRDKNCYHIAGREVDEEIINQANNIINQKHRRGRHVTEDTLRAEREILNLKKIERNLDESHKEMKQIAQKHRDEFVSFLVKKGVDILNSNNKVSGVARDLEKTVLGTKKLKRELKDIAGKIFQFGIDEVKEEIKRQGRKTNNIYNIKNPVIDDADEALRAIDATLNIAVDGFVAKTMAQWKESVLNLAKRAEVSSEFVRDSLGRVSQNVLNSRLGGVVNDSMGMGRGVQGKAVNEQIEKIIRSEVLDTSTCSNCFAVDGLEFDGFNDPEFSPFQNGVYSQCEGEDRCRGINILIMK